MFRQNYDIIKAHNGEIKVETKEASSPAHDGSDRDEVVGLGQGAEFIIQLPVEKTSS